MRKICRYIIFLCIVFSCTPILFATEVDVYASSYLTRRHEQRTRDGLKEKKNVTLQDVDLEVLRTLYMNQIDKVVIPVFDEDVIFKRISHRNRERTATWIGRNLARDASVLLTLGADHFFGRVVIDGNSILFEPTGIALQAMSFDIDETYEIPLINDEVIPPEESKEFSSAWESADDGTRIDVMIIYINGMARAHPGSQINTRIQYLIDLANLSYSNSNINTELNLVYSFAANSPVRYPFPFSVARTNTLPCLSWHLTHKAL